MKTHLIYFWGLALLIQDYRQTHHIIFRNETLKRYILSTNNTWLRGDLHNLTMLGLIYGFFSSVESRFRQGVGYLLEHQNNIHILKFTNVQSVFSSSKTFFWLWVLFLVLFQLRFLCSSALLILFALSCLLSACWERSVSFYAFGGQF